MSALSDPLPRPRTAEARSHWPVSQELSSCSAGCSGSRHCSDPLPSLPTPRAAAAGPRASAARLACRSSSRAAEARRRSRDMRRRRTRRHAKRCLLCAAASPRACFEDTTSDDDDHLTGNSFLLLCAHALVAPVLLSGLLEVDELLVALMCRFPGRVHIRSAGQGPQLSARVDVHATSLASFMWRTYVVAQHSSTSTLVNLTSMFIRFACLQTRRTAAGVPSMPLCPKLDSDALLENASPVSQSCRCTDTARWEKPRRIALNVLLAVRTVLGARGYRCGCR